MFLQCIPDGAGKFAKTGRKEWNWRLHGCEPEEVTTWKESTKPSPRLSFSRGCCSGLENGEDAEFGSWTQRVAATGIALTAYKTL
jgi:hypothetical protein